jgi:lysyl-tRNA synthetase class 2
MDRTHNPEFTMRNSIRPTPICRHDGHHGNLFHHLAKDICKNPVTSSAVTTSTGQPFTQAPMTELVSLHAGIDLSDMDYHKPWLLPRAQAGIPPGAGVGKLIALLFEHFVEPKLIQPTFVTDFPRRYLPWPRLNPVILYWQTASSSSSRL